MTRFANLLLSAYFLVTCKQVANAKSILQETSYGIGASINSTHSGISNILERGIFFRGILTNRLSARHSYSLSGFMKNLQMLPSQNIKNEYALNLMHHFETKKWAHDSFISYQTDEGSFQDHLWTDEFIFYSTKRASINHETAYQITNIINLGLSLSYRNEAISNRIEDQRVVKFSIQQQVSPRFNFALTSIHLTTRMANEISHTHIPMLEYRWLVTRNMHLRGSIKTYSITKTLNKKGPGGNLSFLLTQKNRYFEFNYLDQLSDEGGLIFREWKRGYTFFSHLYFARHHSIKSSYSHRHFVILQDDQTNFHYLERALSASYLYTNQTHLGDFQLEIALEGARKIFANNSIDSTALSLSFNLAR